MALQDSIVRVTGADGKANAFGTAFVVHDDAVHTHLITCEHVVREVGGRDCIRIDEHTATVVASGEDVGLDLCVLRVDGSLTRPSLSMRDNGAANHPFVTAGFQAYADRYLIREISGSLGTRVGVETAHGTARVDAWDLVMTTEGRLQRGYSGAPVASAATGEVLGIVTHREDDGRRGLALSIASLHQLDLAPSLQRFLKIPRSSGRDSQDLQQRRADTPGEVVRIDEFIQLDFVRVPEGVFRMGSNPRKDRSAESWEQPQHEVYLSEFHIAMYTITQEHFSVFVADTGYITTAEQQHSSYVWGGEHTGIMKVLGANWRDPTGPEYGIYETTGPFGPELVKTVNNGNDERPFTRHPVVQVSWHDAINFCSWLTKRTGIVFRLPTEAEWEKAARGTDGRKYPWGASRPTPKRLNYNDNVGATTPVGSYPDGVSPYGAYDMAGNVWEWCSDWYSDNYYAASPPRDPSGPPMGELKVYRGGAYGLDQPWGVRCTDRYGFYPYGRYTGVGFRIATSAFGQPTG
jgi:formylglycine-generating enzyme required for sulfatase activity